MSFLVATFLVPETAGRPLRPYHEDSVSAAPVRIVAWRSLNPCITTLAGLLSALRGPDDRPAISISVADAAQPVGDLLRGQPDGVTEILVLVR